MYDYKTIIIRIIIISSILFVIGCQGGNGSSSSSSNKSNNSISTCQLDKMCDEYQSMVNRMILATNSKDILIIQRITNEITNWMSKWESALKNNSCSEQEMMAASSRMMSIASSLMSDY